MSDLIDETGKYEWVWETLPTGVQEAINAASSKNEEQALAIRELVEVLERLSTFEAFTTEGWGFSHPEIVARVDFARAAIAKAKP